MTTASLRWTAVTPGGEVPLPDVLTSTLGLSYGDPAGGEVVYPLSGSRADRLDARLHEVPLLRAHASVGGGAWQVVGGDLVALQVETDRHAEAPTVKVALTDAVHAVLDTVTLWPKDGAAVDADGNRVFTSATPGAIVLTWLAEAKARGEATYVTTDATATHDSNGQPWAREITLAYGHEEQTLASVIEALWASGMCDWATRPGGELVLANPDALTVDRAATITLHAGADVSNTPQTLGGGTTAHVVRVVGDDGEAVVLQDPELPVGPTGKRAVVVSGGGATDEGTLRTIGQAWIKQHNRAADHLTRELVWGGKFLPLRDYGLGDHITAPGATDALERCRVSEITLSTEGAELTPDCAIALNGKYSDPLLRLARRQQGIVGGAETGGGNGGRPRPDGPDKRTPATPAGLSVTSEAYTVRKSQTAAVARAVWAPTTTDDRGVAMSVSAYEVRWRRESPADRPWRTASVTDTDHTVDNLAAGGRYEWQVRAVGQLAKSPWSASKWHRNAEDGTPPPKPSTPTLTAVRRIVTVGWDGFTAEGGRMPLDTGKVQAAVYSASTLPAQITADMIYRGGVMWDATGDWESPLSLTVADSQLGDVFARIRAVDDTGNASEWSDEATIHVKPTVDVGEIDDAITDAIADAGDRIDQITDEVIPGLRGDMDAADQAAQDAAARAASDAAAAQQTADQADAAAAAAAGRSTVVHSETAPDDTGVLWIDADGRPHVWDGAQWVLSTDQRILDAAAEADAARDAAQAAQDAADAAQEAAEGAQSTADDALARAITADGRVTVSSRVPVTADGAGKPVGALWQTYSGEELVAFYRWDGSKWRAMPLSRTIIPLLDIGQGTFGTLDGARLKAGSVATNRLAVTDWTNHVENPAPEMRPEGESDGWGGAVSLDAAGNPRILRGGGSNGYGTTWNARKIVVTPGDRTPYRLTAEVTGGINPAEARLGIYWQKSDNSTLSYAYTPMVTTTGGTPQTIDHTLTPPDGAALGTVMVQVVGDLSSPTASFRNVTARRQVPSVLIEDGAITAPKITASEELTAKIASFLKVRAGQIDVNSLAADEVFAALMRAQVLQLGAIHPEHLSFGTDEIIPDPLWFDAARRSSRSQGSGAWTFSPATDWTWAATGGQTHVLRAYNGSLKDNDSVALTDITAAAPGEIFSLEMTAGCTTRTPTGTIYFQAVYRRPDGSLLFSTSNAVAASAFKTANRMQTFRRIVTVPDGVDGVMFRIVAASVTNASTGTWAVSRVSAHKGNVTRDQSGAGAMFSPQGIHIWNQLGEDTFKVGIDENAVIAADTIRTGVRTGGPQVMLSNTVIGTGLPGMWLSDSGTFGNSSSRIYLRSMPEGNVLGLRSAEHSDGRRPPVYAEGGLSVGPDSASTARLTLNADGNLVTNDICRFLAGASGPFDTREAIRIDSVGDLSARTSLPTTPGNWTTGNSANMYIGGTGNIFMCTSVLAAKVNITTVGQTDLPDPLDLRPVTYYDRSEAENRARFLAGDWPQEEPEPRVPRRFLGLIAEEVEAAGFPELVTYDEDGRLQGVAYERLAVALLPRLAAQQAQIDTLTARLDALEAR